MSFSKYNLSDYSLTVNVDYHNRTASAALVNPYTTGETLPTKIAYVYDDKGVIIQRILLNSGETLPYGSVLRGTDDLGLDHSYGDGQGGLDTSIQTTINDAVFYTLYPTQWEVSAEPSGAIFVNETRAIEQVLVNSKFNYFEKKDDSYPNVPVVIERGDAVAHGTVDVVTGSNVFTLTTTNAAGAYSSQNMLNCMAEVISGASSGQTFAVVGQVGTELTADTDVTDLSGQLLKLMPYRTVTGYSGWEDHSAGANLGSGGVQGRFDLDTTIPTKVGSLLFNDGNYSGVEYGKYPDLGVDTSLTAGFFPYSVVTVTGDAHDKDIAPGDVIFFNPQSAPANTHTGVIVEVRDHGTASEGDTALLYWPEDQPAAASTYTIHRSNSFNLLTYPQFGTDYLVVASDSLVTATGQKYVTQFRTPDVVVDFAANEFESTFADVTETTNFHIGPIRLSDGTTLDDGQAGANGVMPLLHFSGLVTNGNLTSPTTVVEKEAFSSQSPSAAHKFDGLFFKDGIMTLAAQNSFSASETMICKATITYGGVTLNQIYTVPVQPSV